MLFRRDGHTKRSRTEERSLGAEEAAEDQASFFDEGEDVFAVFGLVAHVGHALFYEEDAESAYLRSSAERVVPGSSFSKGL